MTTHSCNEALGPIDAVEHSTISEHISEPKEKVPNSINIPRSLKIWRIILPNVRNGRP